MVEIRTLPQVSPTSTTTDCRLNRAPPRDVGSHQQQPPDIGDHPVADQGTFVP